MRALKRIVSCGMARVRISFLWFIVFRAPCPRPATALVSRYGRRNSSAGRADGQSTSPINAALREKSPSDFPRQEHMWHKVPLRMLLGALCAAAPRLRPQRLFAAGTTLAASLPVFCFAADLASSKGPAAPDALRAFSWTGLYIGANVGAWFAPINPGYEAVGFPSAGFDLVPNGGGQKAGVAGGFQAGCARLRNGFRLS